MLKRIHLRINEYVILPKGEKSFYNKLTRLVQRNLYPQKPLNADVWGKLIQLFELTLLIF